MSENIVLIGFEDESKAFQALSVVRRAAAAGRLSLHGAAVIERTLDGQYRVRDGNEGDLVGTGVVGGTVLGTLLGVLGGPLGMLLGASTGALIGGATDLKQADRGETVLGQMAKVVLPGTTALVFSADEMNPEVVDAEMLPLGGLVLRRPTADVEAEIRVQQEAQRAAESAASKVLREQHREETRLKIDAAGQNMREGLRRTFTDG